MTNRYLDDLHDYPFTKLAALTADLEVTSNLPHIPLSLGEPKHPPPDFVLQALSDTELLAASLASYPPTKGTDELRGAIADWLVSRFTVKTSADTQILPVNGTREALFSFAQATLSDQSGLVLMPNPFYQIYEGAALLAGAHPVYINNDAEADYQQDFTRLSEQQWQKTELVYICSPGNPTGQLMPLEQMQWLIEQSMKYDFVIASDECYSEIYLSDEAAPYSLLNAAHAMGNTDYKNCMVFHSLSKRSNLPGLRSGFVAGDADLIAKYLKYRTYHGCAMSPHHQTASVLAWQDETHVSANRDLYREKFRRVAEVLADTFTIKDPQGGFYYWLPTPIDDREFSRRLLAEYQVTVLPGQFLARPDEGGHNPGTNHVRVAWVAPLETCVEGAQRLAEFTNSL